MIWILGYLLLGVVANVLYVYFITSGTYSSDVTSEHIPIMVLNMFAGPVTVFVGISLLFSSWLSERLVKQPKVLFKAKRK